MRLYLLLFGWFLFTSASHASASSLCCCFSACVCLPRNREQKRSKEEKKNGDLFLLRRQKKDPCPSHLLWTKQMPVPILSMLAEHATPPSLPAVPHGCSQYVFPMIALPTKVAVVPAIIVVHGLRLGRPPLYMLRSEGGFRVKRERERDEIRGKEPVLQKMLLKWTPCCC